MSAQLRRDTFGAKSEKSDPDQQHLPFEDVEVAVGSLAEASDAAQKAIGNEKKAARSLRRNKWHLPPHFERVEQVIEPDSTRCPCGCGDMVIHLRAAQCAIVIRHRNRSDHEHLFRPAIPCLLAPRKQSRSDSPTRACLPASCWRMGPCLTICRRLRRALPCREPTAGWA